MNKPPMILDIKGNCLDDGPGIRTVVFFKGCPLDCVWCHNPESKSPWPEISFDRNACILCNQCLGVCRKNALNRQTPDYIDRSRCDLCFDCVEACTAEALTRQGQTMTLAEVFYKIARDKPFFDTSGGGLTLSGGEPLLQMDFASALLKAARAEKIHTLVETCGLFSFEAFTEKILPHCDQIYMDIKLVDLDTHKKFCGASNQTILKNLKKLSRLAEIGQIKFLPRVPLIPGITDTQKNLEAIADLLKENHLPKVQLLEYNPSWFNKCIKLGKPNPLAGQKGMEAWLAPEQIDVCRSIFTTRGIQVK